MAFPQKPTVFTQLVKAGTGAEATVAVPQGCNHFTMTSDGGTTRHAPATGTVATGTPTYNGSTRTFADPNMAGRTLYVLSPVGTTAYFDFFYASGV